MRLSMADDLFELDRRSSIGHPLFAGTLGFSQRMKGASERTPLVQQVTTDMPIHASAVDSYRPPGFLAYSTNAL